jgi:IS66 Orf2 like protein
LLSILSANGDIALGVSTTIGANGRVPVSSSTSRRGRFQWPKVENAVMRLSATQLSALVEGLDWKRVGAVKDTPAPRLPG